MKLLLNSFVLGLFSISLSFGMQQPTSSPVASWGFLTPVAQAINNLVINGLKFNDQTNTTITQAAAQLPRTTENLAIGMTNIGSAFAETSKNLTDKGIKLNDETLHGLNQIMTNGIRAQVNVAVDRETLQALTTAAQQINRETARFIKLCMINGIAGLVALTGVILIAKQLYKDAQPSDHIEISDQPSTFQSKIYSLLKSPYSTGTVALIAGVLLTLKSDALVTALE